MSRDFIDELLNALNRVVTPDVPALREVLIVSGMPMGTENLRYLSFNRQTVTSENRKTDFSAVAVINNRRAAHWRLRGYHKKVSQVVFSTRWTRNPLDLFLNNLRCDPDMMNLLASSASDYTLLGILQVDEKRGGGLLKRKFRHVRPVVAVPGFDRDKLEKVIAFERSNEIRKIRIRGFPLYRKIGRRLTVPKPIL